MLTWTGSCNFTFNTCFMLWGLNDTSTLWGRTERPWPRGDITLIYLPPKLGQPPTAMFAIFTAPSPRKVKKKTEKKKSVIWNAVGRWVQPQHCLFSQEHSRSWQLFPRLESWVSEQFFQTAARARNSHRNAYRKNDSFFLHFHSGGTEKEGSLGLSIF